MKNVEGKVVLITGASSGIGREAYERQGDYFSRLYYLEKLPGEK